MPQFWDDSDWDSLLQLVHGRDVIPVIGPGMVKIPGKPGEPASSLYRLLAPSLANRLGLDDPDSFDDCRDVAKRFVTTFSGHTRHKLLPRFAQLLRDFAGPLPSGLAALARITDFMARALLVRDGFSQAINTLRFKPKAGPLELRDVPASRFGPPILFHILGDCAEPDDFAFLEEDYIEYVIALIEKRSSLPVLTTRLREQNLLLLGAPSEDWVVRFLLRVARGQRLSDVSDQRLTYLADRADKLGAPMMFFFDRLLRSTRVIDGSPIAFAEELERRWQDKFGRTDPAAVQFEIDAFVNSLPNEPPEDCVFISYSRDDLGRLLPYLLALQHADIPIWFDKKGLMSGTPYTTEIEQAIKERSVLFCAFVSKATEGDPTRYVHRERQWAAERHVSGRLYYMPFILDLPLDKRPKLEPERVSTVHYDRLSGLDPEHFAARVRVQLANKMRQIHA
jgi:hypothetical protein